MIASDPSQALKAKAHLSKAIASSDKLAPPMAKEAMHLIQMIDQQRASATLDGPCPAFPSRLRVYSRFLVWS